MPSRTYMLLGLLLLAGCGRQPLLRDVTVEPAAITPNQDGDADVTRIGYTVGAPARLTIELIGADGVTHVLRDGLPRSPGHRQALFGGVIDGQMLADGDYVVRVSAVPLQATGGPPVQTDGRLAIHGGDTRPPELAGFTIQPADFTPNQDGLGDRVAISYRLDEPADVRLWLETEDGKYVTDILEEEESAVASGSVGAHQYDYDAGVDSDAPPPPDGRYVIVGQARDAAGNVWQGRLPLTIAAGGQPRAAMVGDVSWSAKTLPLGATLSFTATVENVGGTPIRTRGPEPGFIYDNSTTFNRSLPPAFLLLARSRRPGAPGYRAASTVVPVEGGAPAEVVLDLVATPADRPPEWLQAPSPTAQPAGFTTAEDPTPETVTVCGRVTEGGRPASQAEVFAFEADGDKGARATVDAAGQFCFEGLRVPPAFERSLARVPGVIRLGLEYDEKLTDLEYPYRWQLGRTSELDVCDGGRELYLCLQPGQKVQVSGGVRFLERPFRRLTNVYLALMHEDVRRMHGPYGQQALTIEH
jgi:hypothetical protein